MCTYFQYKLSIVKITITLGLLIFPGSGKTYTMKPLPLRAAEDIVRLLHQPYYRNQNFKLWLSYFEIYGGKLFDLLCDRRLVSPYLLMSYNLCTLSKNFNLMVFALPCMHPSFQISIKNQVASKSIDLCLILFESSWKYQWKCNISLQIMSCLIFFAWFAIPSHPGADWHGSTPHLETLAREERARRKERKREGGSGRERERESLGFLPPSLSLFISFLLSLPFSLWHPFCGTL